MCQISSCAVWEKPAWSQLGEKFGAGEAQDAIAKEAVLTPVEKDPPA